MIVLDFQIQTKKLVTAKQPDVGVIEDLQQKAVLIDATVPSVSSIEKMEHEKLEKIPAAERGSRKDLENEGNSGASGNPSTQGCDLQTGRVTPADSRNNIRDLSPDERSGKQSWDAV